MGKKITQLTYFTGKQYEGEELFAMVEDGVTLGAPISSFQTYLSGVCTIASPRKNNFFACTQTIQGSLCATQNLTVGGDHINTGSSSAIAGGTQSTVTGSCAFVGGGEGHQVTNSNGVVVGGECNNNFGTCATIAGGCGIELVPIALQLLAE